MTYSEWKKEVMERNLIILRLGIPRNLFDGGMYETDRDE